MAKKRTTSDLDTHLGYWMRYVSNHVSHAFAQKVEAKGVTVAEWVVLRQLYGADGQNPSELAEQLGMTRGAISKLVERLHQKQLVVRKSVVGDGRYQTIELTPAGRRLVPTLAKLADANDQAFFGHLSERDKKLLTTVLQDIVRRNGWKQSPIE
ncbi:MarR family winged helix-turn-helix transcriptional regulator [Aeoliella sp. SH292]|uniref:MarR family winged helix-turn-helix transcriptional regulator n=1 Tax=Aeoliella sp. SH292 TaxID=3454464 RepID=UPI003F9D55C3